jgi:hypothetical protein
MSEMHDMSLGKLLAAAKEDALNDATSSVEAIWQAENELLRLARSAGHSQDAAMHGYAAAALAEALHCLRQLAGSAKREASK